MVSFISSRRYGTNLPRVRDRGFRANLSGCLDRFPAVATGVARCAGRPGAAPRSALCRPGSRPRPRPATIVNVPVKGGAILTGGTLGNLTINGGIDSQSALVSGGSIGSPRGKLRVGNISGIVAAVGSISVAQIGTTNTAMFYKSNDTLDVGVIDAIFSHGVSPLSPADLFDTSPPMHLLNFSQILTNLNSLKVVGANNQTKLSL